MTLVPSGAEKQVQAALRTWEKWVAAGSSKDKYGDSVGHDNYHDHIEKISDNLYKFDIQTDDDWTGNDTWIEGTFSVSKYGAVELITCKEHG